MYNVGQKHYKTFLARIATDLGLTIDQIIDFELNAYDTHMPAITGLHNEFISSPRLDNLASSLTSLDALVSHHKNDPKANADISMIMLFDHEEVGSCSAQGADSNMVVETCERIFGAFSQPGQVKEDYYRAIHKSYFVSADMAHAVHPNYKEKHQEQHQPRIHDGVVFKINANQRYMTDSASSALLRELALQCKVPVQDFIVKQDGLCGGTIGPMVAAKAGIKTLDIGAPQLSMHSIRETCGIIDLKYYRSLFECFLNNYSALYHKQSVLNDVVAAK